MDWSDNLVNPTKFNDSILRKKKFIIKNNSTKNPHINPFLHELLGHISLIREFHHSKAKSFWFYEDELFSAYQTLTSPYIMRRKKKQMEFLTHEFSHGSSCQTIEEWKENECTNNLVSSYPKNWSTILFWQQSWDFFPVA